MSLKSILAKSARKFAALALVSTLALTGCTSTAGDGSAQPLKKEDLVMVVSVINTTNPYFAANILGAQVQAGQQNFANRQAMLNYLSGQNAQDLSAEPSRGGLYNQQMGMGSATGQNWANNLTQQNVAQNAMNFQGQMAGYNADMANQAKTQNALGSLGSMAGLGMANWLNAGKK